MPFQITDNRAVSVVLTPGPVIDADNLEAIITSDGASPNDPQQCVFAYRHHQPLGKASTRFATKREAEMMDNQLQPVRATGPG